MGDCKVGRFERLQGCLSIRPFELHDSAYREQRFSLKFELLSSITYHSKFPHILYIIYAKLFILEIAKLELNIASEQIS